jgi:hypothetical protein
MTTVKVRRKAASGERERRAMRDAKCVAPCPCDEPRPTTTTT